MVARQEAMDRFISLAGWDPATCHALAADASFRRYFRIDLPSRAVLMDAPPDKEDIVPFVAVTEYLRRRGYTAPGILAIDLEDGFLLLDDFGDDKFTGLLETAAESREQDLYSLAVNVLIDLHRVPPPASLPVRGGGTYNLPAYDDDLLWDEASLFTDWYLPAIEGQDIAAADRAEFESLWRESFSALETQPDGLVLRDYHVDNLMLVADHEGLAQVGLLDFQDAVIGPVAYDLVSLLQDARRDVPPTIERLMLDAYLDAYPELDRNAFRTAYAVLGAQRNVKIIGIFTRLCRRDGKAHYLQLIPRVWGLLERDLAHPRLAGIKAWFDARVPSRTRQTPPDANE